MGKSIIVFTRTVAHAQEQHYWQEFWDLMPFHYMVNYHNLKD